MDEMEKKLQEKIKTRKEAYENMKQVKKVSLEQLQAKIEDKEMTAFLNDISSDRLSQSAVLAGGFVPKFRRRVPGAQLSIYAPFCPFPPSEKSGIKWEKFPGFTKVGT